MVNVDLVKRMPIPTRKKHRKRKVHYYCRCCGVRAGGRWLLRDGRVKIPSRPWRGTLWLRGWSFSEKPRGWFCPECSVMLTESRALVALRGAPSCGYQPPYVRRHDRVRGLAYLLLHAVACVHLAVRRRARLWWGLSQS